MLVLASLLYSSMSAVCALPCAAPSHVAHAQQQAGEVRADKLVARVAVVDGVASTQLTLTLSNSGAAPAEATWLLPLPEGSVVDGFRMTMDGALASGEVLDAPRARAVYESIVRSRRDPGLLEYVGRGCLRARVFPIPARGQLDVEVTYREVLPRFDGLQRWALPLASGIEGRAPDQFVLDLSIESSNGLQHVFSHTDGVHVARVDGRKARASFEGRGQALRGRELAVLYSPLERDLGLDVLSTKSGEFGTFLVLASPRQELDSTAVIPRRIVFALDTSGSMEGVKFEQARGALRAFLASLRPHDEFNIVTYSTDADLLFPAAVAADAAHLAQALERVEGLTPRGGTNIDEALKASLEPLPIDRERVSIVVFLTDGAPTVQETRTDALLTSAAFANTASARIFVFGVGHDVNTQLLDKLAEQSGAERMYVSPEQRIDTAAQELFQKLSEPVLMNLELSIEGVNVQRLTSRRLPDLYRGGRVSLFGRYSGGGRAKVTLRGDSAGRKVEIVREVEFAAAPRRPLEFIEALWAQRRVAALLEQMRLHSADKELVDEVRALGVEFGIVTPYTSHLILEQGLLPPAPRPPPGSGGPSSPGPASPGRVGGSGPASPGGGGGPTRSREELLLALAERLQEAGALPSGASAAQLRAEAEQVVNEMLASSQALSGLSTRTTGAAAVADSAYLERLLGAGSIHVGSDDFFLGRGENSRSENFIALFTRRVAAKTFRLTEGVWRDGAILESETPRKRLEAYSEAWFDVLVERPALGAYFAFSEKLDVLFEGVVYEVRPPAKPQAGG